MALDGITIACLVNELNNTILDGRINKIAQPEKDELLLTIKNKTVGQTRLDISASASLPLVYLTDENKPGPLTAPNFCMLLRKHIANGKIMSISQPGMERIINIEIEHFDDMGDLRRKFLIIELMGKHSNIIFTDENMMILDSIKHIGANVSSVREVLPGREYFIPNTQDKFDPLKSSKEEFFENVYSKPVNLAKAIYTTYTGISPVIANEICFRAGIDGGSFKDELSDDLKLHLYNIFSYMMQDIKENKFQPCLIFDENELPVEFAAVNLSIYQDMNIKNMSSISQVLVSYYSNKNKSSRIRQKSVDLRKITSTILDRERKKYSLQLKQLEDTKDRDKYRVYGELINTYGYNLEAGATKLTALNYYTNEEVTIPLDKNKSIQENSVHYFNKYNKLKRTHDSLEELIQLTAKEISHLESISTAIDLAEAYEDLEEIRDELVEFGYIRKKNKGPNKKSKSKPHHFISSEGYHIYVGKNNYQNDYLTFKFATGNDWWFHSKTIHGAHVILKNDGANVSDKAIEEAAMVAAYYSGGRESGKVEIDYTQKKNIKKPNGANPGFVVYYTNYSMNIKPSLEYVSKAE